MIIYCQICKQPIARADKLSYPLTGEQFQSYDPAHGYPAPFMAGAEWRYMKCPYCRFRPFTEDDKVLIDAAKNEFLVLDKRIQMVHTENTNILACQYCGKVCKSKTGLMAHERVCNSRPKIDG